MKYPLLVLILCLLLGLCACQGQETNQEANSQTETAEKGRQIILPELEEDFFEVFAQNCNVLRDNSYYGGNGAYFYMISGRPLTEEELTVTSSTQVDFVPVLIDLNYEEHSFLGELLLLYQGYSPEEIAARWEASLPEKQQQEIYALEADFEAIRDSVPNIYFYELSFMPYNTETKEIPESYSISDMTVTVKGVSKTYTFENFSRIVGENPNLHYTGDAYPCGTVSCNRDLSVRPNSQGTYVLPIEMEAYTAFTLEAVRFAHCPDLELLGAEISVTDKQGNTVSMEWDGTSPLDFSPGEQLAITLEVKDPNLAGLLCFQRCNYVLLDYSNGDGNLYTQEFSFHLRESLINPYFYLAALDGYDVLGLFDLIYQ